MRVRTIFRHSVFAWACSASPSNSLAMFWDTQTPIHAKWTKRRLTTLSTSWRNRNPLPIWVVPCALGAYECVLQEGSKAYEAYGTEHIQERHRHRYEFNTAYKTEYEAAGMKCVGINPESDLVEIVEIPALKWFVGTQFHPEYSSTVLTPAPVVRSLCESCD